MHIAIYLTKIVQTVEGEALWIDEMMTHSSTKIKRVESLHLAIDHYRKT